MNRDYWKRNTFGMRYGQIALLGASVNTGRSTFGSGNIITNEPVANTFEKDDNANRSDSNTSNKPAEPNKS